MHFQEKITLKNNRYYNPKHYFNGFVLVQHHFCARKGQLFLTNH